MKKMRPDRTLESMNQTPQFPQSSAGPHMHSGNAFAYAPTPSTGTAYWLLYLVLYLPIPILNMIVTLVIEFAMRKGAVRIGGPAEANNRHAINWLLTAGLATTATTVLHFGLLLAVAGFDGGVGRDDPFFGVLNVTGALCILTSLCAGITTLVFLILGAVRASKGGEFNPRIAIPFVRAPR